MGVRGVRGAITVEANAAADIVEATKELLTTIVERNRLDVEDIASAFITTTEDINAIFPAKAARELPDWEFVPLMCAREVPVVGSLPLCIRVLLHVNTDKSAKEIQHVFLREAAKLRPDLSK